MTNPDVASMSYRDRKEYELKKVQQRTAAIILFTIVVSIVSGLLGLCKVLIDQDRGGDAAFLLFMSAVVSVIAVVVIRGLLQQPLVSITWLVVSILPVALTAFWLF